MKKVLVVCPLSNMKKYEKELKRCQIVGFRGKTAPKDGEPEDVFYLNNLAWMPKDRVSYEVEGDELLIRVRLSDGDILALGDADGIAEKRVIK